MALLKKPLAISLALFAASAVGCSDRSLEDDTPRDPDPPELTVLTPDRGTTSTQNTVSVTGRVRDFQSGVDTVKVNGVAATVSSDGRFEAEVNLAAGLNLLQTVAVDVAGNETIDTRAMLTGELAPHDQTVREAMAAHLSAETFDVMAAITANWVNVTDLGVLAQAANPVFYNGGCLGAEVDVETIEKSGVELALEPAGGGVNVTFSLNDLDVVMDVDYEVACIGGSAGLYLTADKFTISGMLSIGLENNELVIDLVDTQASFEGFELDVGVIPSSVVEFFVDDIDERVANMIRNQAATLIPDMASDFLGNLTSNAFELPLFGRTMSLAVTPTVADFTPGGGTIALDTNITVKDAFGPGYVFTPTPMPSATELRSTGQAFRLAVADDAFNQILASMHASGMLEQSFELEGEGDGSLLGNIADRIDMHMLLPPVVKADLEGGSIEVVVGDLLIDVVNIQDGQELVVTRAAISGRLQLKVSVTDGAIKLVTMTPELWVDLVDDGVSGPNPLAYDEVEKIASLGSARIANIIDEMLGGLPLPVFAGTTLGETTVEPSAGYVVVGGALAPAPMP